MVLALFATCVLGTGAAPEWGDFRGPSGLGVSLDSTLPSRFDPESNLRFRIEVPPGYSSPTVAGDRVFLTAAKEKELLTLCYSRTDGELLWQRAIPFHGRRTGANSPAAATPVTDGEQVFSLFQDFGLAVYDLEGEPTWQLEMPPLRIPHGLSTSPVLHEDSVILQLDQDSGSCLLSLDKYGSGEVWRTERPSSTHSYSTPAIHVPKDGPAQVIVAGSFHTDAYSFETGELLWSVAEGAFMTKAVPLVVGDRCVLLSFAQGSTEAGLPRISQSFEEALAEKDADGDGKISKKEMDHPGLNAAWAVFDLNDDDALDARDWEYLRSSNSPTGGLYCLRMDGTGDVTNSHVVWKYDGRRGLPDVTTPVVVGGAVHVVREGGLLSSFDQTTGELLRQERVGEPDRYFASPISDGKALLLASHSGQLHLVSAGAEHEVLASANLGEELWSTPALAGHDLFVRTQRALYCFTAEVE